MSANELAKGNTRPVLPGNFPNKCQVIFEGRRDLNGIKEAHPYIKNISVKVEDMDLHFVRNSNEKSWKWTLLKRVLSYDHESRTVTVLGRNGCTVCAAIEDVRIFGLDNDLSTAIQESIDTIECSQQDGIVKSVSSEADKNTHTLMTPFWPPIFHCLGAHVCSYFWWQIEVWWPIDESSNLRRYLSIIFSPFHPKLTMTMDAMKYWNLILKHGDSYGMGVWILLWLMRFSNSPVLSWRREGVRMCFCTTKIPRQRSFFSVRINLYHRMWPKIHMIRKLRPLRRLWKGFTYLEHSCLHFSSRYHGCRQRVS